NPSVDFLSQKEIDDIRTDLNKIAPFIKANGQNYYIVKHHMGETRHSFAWPLDESLRPPAQLFFPKDAGVAGIPYLNIGLGDGRMMQILALDPSIERTLKVFDGKNMPLDNILEYSEKANAAVWETWQ